MAHEVPLGTEAKKETERLLRKAGVALTKLSRFYINSGVLHLVSNKNGAIGICGDVIPPGTKIGDGPTLNKRGPEACPVCRGRQVIRKQRVVGKLAFNPDKDINEAAQEVIDMEV